MHTLGRKKKLKSVAVREGLQGREVASAPTAVSDSAAGLMYDL